MAQLTLLLLSVTVVTLLTGAGLALLSFRAYRRTEATPLRSLTFGFGAITAGGTLDAIDWLLSAETTTGIVAGTSLVALGLLSFVHALYVGDSLAAPRGTLPDHEPR